MNNLQLEQYIDAHNRQLELIDRLKKELEEYRSIAEQMGAAKAISEKEQWEKCADSLVDYAHEFVAHLSLWGKGYVRYDKDIQQAEDAIEEYQRLKQEPKK
jgi:hypothetical protein